MDKMTITFTLKFGVYLNTNEATLKIILISCICIAYEKTLLSVCLFVFPNVLKPG
jgi:hypothetical protein